jgi:hypothetical protein
VGAESEGKLRRLEYARDLRPSAAASVTEQNIGAFLEAGANDATPSRITPWLWAVNGSAGVLATSAAVLLSLETSLNHALWVGALGYALLSAVGVQLLKLPAIQPEASGSLAERQLAGQHTRAA